MKILKNKLMLFFITFIIIMYGVASYQGENKVKNVVKEMHEKCQEFDYTYIEEINVEYNQICIECVNIQQVTERGTSGVHITVCEDI